ncbi:YqeB family protein [Micromonospora aurantiaca (nom. illeg.)]|uniref:YqeB family protein n=1 Tax=Micromonospora aurantiaca (nom. illeg.) TaxID=47850 RepID=UPI003EC05A79
MAVRQPGEDVVVDGGRGELVLMWAEFPLLGAGLGAGLTALSGWIAGLAWFPFQGLFELLARWPDERSYPIGAGAGLLGGLFLAVVAVRERLTVTVGHRTVRLHRDGHGRDLARAGVAGVFVDGKALVLLDSAGGELAREKSDLDTERLREAFTRQGWPWTGQDPHRDAYRRWVEGLPGLPPGGDALLRARQRALDRGNDAETRELHGELARLGVVVRDEGKRQYWRLVTSPPSG